MADKLQVNRLVGFYPFYLLGIFLKEKDLLTTKKISLWRVTSVIVMVLYIGACCFVKGLAYKSGFFLQTSSSAMTVAQFYISYVFIMTICVGLIKSAQNRENFFSKYGGRTLNVYLLHMMVVFPICYGIFRQFDYNIFNVVMNSLAACMLCLVFFSKICDTIMKKVLSQEHWGAVIAAYLITLLLVNSSLFTKIFING